LREQEESEGIKSEEEEEDQNTVHKSLSLLSRLEGRSNWRVVRAGRKVTMKVKVWEGIGFQSNHFKILYQDSLPQQHSPLLDHYQSGRYLPICNERIKIVLPTFHA
jgi:hypothetical protein